MPKTRQLLRRTVLYSGSVFTANFLHWLFAVVARRLTSNDVFAVIAVFSSLSAIGGYFAGAVSQTVERYLSYYLGAEDRARAYGILRSFFFVALGAGTLFISLFLWYRDEITGFLGVQSAGLVAIFAPSLFLYFLLAYQRGVFKALLRFDIVGYLMVVEAAAKIVMLVIASVFSYSLAFIGACSITVSLLVAFCSGTVILHRLRRQVVPKRPEPVPPLAAKEVSWYGLNAFLDNIGLGLLLQVDMLLASHYLSPGEAGLYATLTFFGKILFLSGSMAGPLILPLSSFLFAKGKSGNREFGFLFLYTAAAGGAVMTAFLLFPGFMTHLFAGEHGSETLPYLPAYFIGMWSLLMAQSVSSYFQARKNFWVSRGMLAGAGLMAAGIVLFHASVEDIVRSVMYTGLILFVFSFGYYAYSVRSGLRHLLRSVRNGDALLPFFERNRNL